MLSLQPSVSLAKRYNHSDTPKMIHSPFRSLELNEHRDIEKHTNVVHKY